MMYIYRGIGILVSLLIAFAIASYTEINVINIMAIMAFILSIDTIILDFIKKIYMRAMYKQMEHIFIESEKKKENSDVGGKEE
jgi:uncharacterized protein YacL